MQIDYSKRIFGLDLMRAVAILLVVFSHITWIIPNAQGLIPDLMSVAGVIGVEIFFVLSGFLIGRIIYNLYISDDFSFKSVLHFWVRRWFRTLPNYYFALFVNIAIALFIGSQLPEYLGKYFVFLQNFTTEMPYLFIESWSLSIEEFSYILGPLLLYLTLFIKTKISKSTLFLCITIGIILLFILTKVIYNLNDTSPNMMSWNSGLKAVVIYRLDAIYYGVLAAFISIQRAELWHALRYPLCLIGVLVILSMNFMVPLKGIFIENYPMFWNVWYLPIQSVAILLTLPLLSRINTAPKFILKPITYVSLISYAMYVLHYSIILQLLKYFIPTEGMPKFDVMVYIAVYLSLTIILSYLLYVIFERPCTNLRDSKCIKRYFE